MITMNVREAREAMSRLLDRVEAGEDVVIVRRGKAVARLTGPEQGGVAFPDRSGLRQSIPPMRESAAETVRGLRDDERY